MRPPAPRPLPRRCCPLSRTTTPFCSQTTASSAGPTPSPTPSGWSRSLTPTARPICIAKQIGQPLNFIPESKIQEILALKRRMGLPDARLHTRSTIASPAPGKNVAELERLVEQVVARLEERE